MPAGWENAWDVANLADSDPISEAHVVLEVKRRCRRGGGSDAV